MDNLLSKVRKILNEIAEFATRQLPNVDEKSIRYKKDAADLVSNRDYIMESKIIETIHRIFPDHTVLSEEAGVVGEEHAIHQWLVDPIDGSCNDSHGIPWSSVSVAYVHSGNILAASVIHPYTGEVFQAIRGYGATLNGQKIRVATGQTLAGSVVMTELLNQYPWDGMSGFINFLAQRDATVRIMGSMALSIVQVAAGRAVAATFGDAGSLDVTAGILIALEAGAIVLRNGELLDSLPKGQLIVASPDVANIIKNAVVS